MTCYFDNFNGFLTPFNEIPVFDWLNYDRVGDCSAVDQLIIDELKFLGLLV